MQQEFLLTAILSLSVMALFLGTALVGIRKHHRAYLTAEQIEHRVQRAMDRLDAQLMTDLLTQAEYDCEVSTLDKWAQQQYDRAARANLRDGPWAMVLNKLRNLFRRRLIPGEVQRLEQRSHTRL